MKESPRETIQSFAQVLDSYDFRLKTGLSVRGAGSTLHTKSIPYTEAAKIATGSTTITPDIKPLFDADTAIWDICKQFYERKITSGLGELSWPESESTETVPANSEGAIFALTKEMTNDSVSKAVAFSSLYSDHVLMVLPLHISDCYISYSGSSWPGMRKPWSGMQTILEYNKRYEPLIMAGKCIFLPASNRFEQTSLSSYSISAMEAPVHQIASDIQLLPLNYTNSLNFDKILAQSKVPICEIGLPSFKGLPLSELFQLANNETDSFIKFNYFFTKCLRNLNAGQTSEQIGDLLAEINYEIANLRIEAQRISKLKSLQRAELVFFTIGLGVTLLASTDVAKSIAGVIGSVSLLDLVKGYYNLSREKLALKNSDFYLPFLVEEAKNHP